MSIRNKALLIVLGLVLLAVAVPTAVSAALTNDQIQSIINLLASFGVDSATINNVRISLNGGTPNINVPTCQPNWQIGAWNLCANGSQTRPVTDNNNCGTQINQPATVQSCVQKPGVVIQANNLDGPVNLFLTLGSGASVSSSGITLTKDINLQWSGLNVASCVASDSLAPAVFSGYKPYLGSQTVTFSGTIKNVSASNNKISDTFRINCIETATGRSVSDSVTVNLFYNVNSNCYTNWQCTEWTNCTSSRQTRTCTDWNGCGSLEGKPLETQSCTVPPTVNLKVNGSDGPVTIVSGSLPTLSWTSSRASSCTASGNVWSGPKPVSGSEKINAVTSAEVFTMSCTNAGGTTTDSVTVNLTSGT
jgi:hypothetical protein